MQQKTTGEPMSEERPRYVEPAGRARPGGHYSHGVVANGFVFVSGQLPISPAGEKLSGASFADQARQVLANVESILKASGSGIDRLVQVRVYIDDMAHWAEFNGVYAEWAGASRPSRAVVPCGALHYGLKLEVEAVAMVGTDR
jgi:reactive intermediate/imine deaminase